MKEILAARRRQLSKPLEIAGSDGRGRFDLNTNYISILTFHDDVHFVLILNSIVVKPERLALISASILARNSGITRVEMLNLEKDCVLIRQRPDEDGNWGDLVIKRGLKRRRPEACSEDQCRGQRGPRTVGHGIGPPARI